MPQYPIQTDELTEKNEFYNEVVRVYDEAKSYLQSFKWCEAVINSCLYTNLGSALCIFLFEINNTQSSEDNYLWVIAGDIPPMYLDIYGSISTKEVLKNYTELAKDWIITVRTGGNLGDCYPFIAEPNNEMANMLAERVSFIKTELIENIDDIVLPAELQNY